MPLAESGSSVRPLWLHDRSRFAKSLAVGASLLVTLIFTDFNSIRWLSLFTVVLVVVWAFAARYAGRQFAAMEAREESATAVV